MDISEGWYDREIPDDCWKRIFYHVLKYRLILKTINNICVEINNKYENADENIYFDFLLVCKKWAMLLPQTINYYNLYLHICNYQYYTGFSLKWITNIYHLDLTYYFRLKFEDFNNLRNVKALDICVNRTNGEDLLLLHNLETLYARECDNYYLLYLMNLPKLRYIDFIYPREKIKVALLNYLVSRGISFNISDQYIK